MFDVITSLPPAYLAGGAGLAIALALFAVLGQADEKVAVRDSLRQLGGMEASGIDNIRDQELLVSPAERLLKPFFDRIQRIGGRFNPPEYVEKVRVKHTQAGIFEPEAVERFLVNRILGWIFVPIWVGIWVFWNPLDWTGWRLLLVLGFGAMLGILGPSNALDKKVKTRQETIRRQLPDVLDLLVISVEAGLGFEQALDRVVNNVPGDLSDEFMRVLGESRAGASRGDALRSMESRCDIPEIRSFVLAMIQADQFGVSIGRVLRAQADELRIKRRQYAQEKAQKAPVKMMIPMVFCIFPALFVVVLGPAIINITKAF